MCVHEGEGELGVCTQHAAARRSTQHGAGCGVCAGQGRREMGWRCRGSQGTTYINMHAWLVHTHACMHACICRGGGVPSGTIMQQEAGSWCPGRGAGSQRALRAVPAAPGGLVKDSASLLRA